MSFQHETVLLSEAVEALNLKPGGTYVDATLGGGGHAEKILQNLTGGRLICFDKDAEAIEAAKKRLKPFLERVTFLHSDFRTMAEALREIGIGEIDGALFDIGVSSPQLDDARRGFSYMKDAPLDMRMDAGALVSAYEVINLWPEQELKRILYEYGQERYAPLIAAAIARRRAKEPIRTTLELSEIIRGAMPPQALREKQHPAKRSFQAIRVSVNDELGALKQALDGAVDMLSPGGRIAVITFHSLEERIVKEKFAEEAKGCVCPPSFPICVCNRKPRLKIITKRPVEPGQEELSKNPRARSAKLRAAQRI